MNGIYTNHAFRLNRWLPRATLPITGHCTICLSSWTTIDIVGLLAPASTHCIASFITDHACLAATGLALILSSWRHKTLGSLTLLALNNISSKCLSVFANRNQKITLMVAYKCTCSIRFNPFHAGFLFVTLYPVMSSNKKTPNPYTSLFTENTSPLFNLLQHCIQYCVGL